MVEGRVRDSYIMFSAFLNQRLRDLQTASCLITYVP